MMIQAILSRNIPRKVLLEMEMLGDRWTATQLQSLGRHQSRRHARPARLDRRRDRSSSGQEVARRACASAAIRFYRQQDMDFRAALHYLHGQFLLVSQTEDSKEGIKAFFEKREPDFKGQ